MVAALTISMNDSGSSASGSRRARRESAGSVFLTLVCENQQGGLGIGSRG